MLFVKQKKIAKATKALPPKTKGKNAGVEAKAKKAQKKEVKAIEVEAVVEVEEVKPEMKDKDMLVAMLDIVKANGGIEAFEVAMKYGAVAGGEVENLEKTAFSSFMQNRPCKFRSGSGFKNMKCSRIVEGTFTPVNKFKCNKCELLTN